MNKHTGDKRAPEAVAKELENIDFAEIEETDLREVFGHGDEGLLANCNCPPEDSLCGCSINSGCPCGEEF